MNTVPPLLKGKKYPCTSHGMSLSCARGSKTHGFIPPPLTNGFIPPLHPTHGFIARTERLKLIYSPRIGGSTVHTLARITLPYAALQPSWLISAQSLVQVQRKDDKKPVSSSTEWSSFIPFYRHSI